MQPSSVHICTPIICSELFNHTYDRAEQSRANASLFGPSPLRCYSKKRVELIVASEAMFDSRIAQA